MLFQRGGGDNSSLGSQAAKILNINGNTPLELVRKRCERVVDALRERVALAKPRRQHDVHHAVPLERKKLLALADTRRAIEEGKRFWRGVVRKDAVDGTLERHVNRLAKVVPDRAVLSQRRGLVVATRHEHDLPSPCAW